MPAVLKGAFPQPPRGARVASVLLEARDEARRIVDAAAAEARTTVRDARADAARMGAEAAALGREEGLGHAAEVVARAAVERDRLLAGAERELVELALEIARRVVAGAAERGAVTIVAARALEAARARERVVVRAHPQDVAALSAAQSDLAAALVRAPGFTLREDAGIARGGVVVETEAGRIDARVETQLAALRRALLPGEAPRVASPPGELQSREPP